MAAELGKQDNGARIISLFDHLMERRQKMDGEPPPPSAPAAARPPVAPVCIEAMAQQARRTAVGRFASRYAA